MNLFKSLSIQYKILLIPVVGSVGFAIYLVVSLLTMSHIVEQLEQAYKVEYRLLQTSEYSLTRLDKIKEIVIMTADRGDELVLLGLKTNLTKDEFRSMISEMEKS